MHTNDLSDEDIIKIMVATDIHLGYMENDPIRGEDSFIAFEEVLCSAAEADVDMVLLGGDLFHHAKPTPHTMLRCTEIIRKYCFGDKAITLELLCDRSQLFKRPVNYEDPNLNVSYPILSIHGNHDDPVGQGAISSLDILSSMGLLNYFGKWNDYTHVRVSPVLIRKGATQLALYGLSHLKDQRLARLFKESKVEMERPDDGDNWFNLLVLHQNRADRGPGNYIQEEVLPDFLDLVVWGHEHDCRVHEEENHNRRFFVTQPGSTVATSLASGEALPKHIALVQIHKKKFILTPVPLKTVRPFIFKTIVLSEKDLGESSVNESEKVQEYLKTKVYEAIEEAQALQSNHPKQPTIPLIRLSVFYERETQDFNRVRFGQNFNGVVANPNDLLVMKREKRVYDKKCDDEGDEQMRATAAAVAASDGVDVESLLVAYFTALPPEKRLSVLSVKAMTEALKDFTLKRDDDIFRTSLEAQRRRVLASLHEALSETNAEVEDRMRTCGNELDACDNEQLKEMIRKAPPAAPLQPTVVLTQTRKAVVVLSSDDESPVAAVPVATRGRGRGRGRPRATPAPPSPPSERRSTPRRNAARKSSSWLQNIMSDRNIHLEDD